MNTIEKIRIINDRVYITIRLSDLGLITLRFYVTVSKEDFIGNLKLALSYPITIKPKYIREEREEATVNEIIMNSAIGALNGGGFVNYMHTGVLQNESGLKVTNEGRQSYALYMHIDARTLEMIEVFPTYEEALLKMLEWRAKETRGVWNFNRIAKRRTTYDAIIWDFLHSIDSIEEMVKYKILYDDQLEYLLRKGLIILPKDYNRV